MSAGRLMGRDPDGPLGTNNSQGAVLFLWRKSSRRSLASAPFPWRGVPALGTCATPPPLGNAVRQPGKRFHPMSPLYPRNCSRPRIA